MLLKFIADLSCVCLWRLHEIIHVKRLPQFQAQRALQKCWPQLLPMLFSVLRRFWSQLENCPCDTQRGKEVSLPFPGHKRWPPELEWGDLPGRHHSDRNPMPHRGLDSPEFLPGPAEHGERGQTPQPSILQFRGLRFGVDPVPPGQNELREPWVPGTQLSPVQWREWCCPRVASGKQTGDHDDTRPGSWCQEENVLQHGVHYVQVPDIYR